MIPGDDVTFDHRKQLTYIRDLGSGGTGSTSLFKDKTTGIFFAIKKFDPKGANDPAECFGRFIDEIKILLRLAHPNIVRIFNYYLYPEALTGYLLMEYISGVSVNEFRVTQQTKNWNEIFSDTVSAFESMEQKGILHRDIRPANIMIDNNGVVKVIDFGFGKQYERVTSLENNSIVLNWPASSPDEVIQDQMYDHRTEVYYLGKLFESLISSDDNFNYFRIIEKMVEKNPKDRFDSFSHVSSALNSSAFDRDLFNDTQKEIYQVFASSLIGCISILTEPLQRVEDPEVILRKLEALLDDSLLETNLQNNSLLIYCFITSGYRYYANNIPVEIVQNFFDFLKNLPKSSRAVVLQNLAVRLRQIKRRSIYDEDIPF